MERGRRDGWNRCDQEDGCRRLHHWRGGGACILGLRLCLSNACRGALAMRVSHAPEILYHNHCHTRDRLMEISISVFASDTKLSPSLPIYPPTCLVSKLQIQITISALKAYKQYIQAHTPDRFQIPPARSLTPNPKMPTTPTPPRKTGRTGSQLLVEPRPSVCQGR